MSRWLWTPVTHYIARPGEYEDQATPEGDLSVDTVSYALQEDVVSYNQVLVEMKSLLDPDHENDFHEVHPAPYQGIISETISWLEQRWVKDFWRDGLLDDQEDKHGADLLYKEEVIPPV